MSIVDVSLITGPARPLILAAGVAALGLLLTCRGRNWWLRRVPLGLSIGTLTAVGLSVGVNQVWRPFPDALPRVILLWAGLTAAGAVLAVARPSRWRGKVLASAAVVTVALCGAAQVNQEFGTYPTLRGVLGLPLVHEIAFTDIPTAAPELITSTTDGPLSAAWSPPATMPEDGVVTTADIPGTSSGFTARPAWIYLPPAYLSSPRAQLPVLVLVPGQPGTPRDWFDGGKLDSVLDAYARGHDGLTPVVVVADSLGDQFAQPLCMDSPTANAFTYLTVDVPRWIRDTLQVDPNPKHWAVGGFSAGGTCALLLAVDAPAVYPTFLDITGEDEPSLGTRDLTVDRIFDGDNDAFTRFNPLDVLTTAELPDSTGTIVAGDEDPDRPQAQHVAAATAAAGMTIRYVELPGGHSWYVWGPGLERTLPWLSTRVGLMP